MRINIEIGDIEAFIELSETNSFAKAANNLSLSQPALSRRIQKLEQELAEVDESFRLAAERSGITLTEIVFSLSEGLNLDDVETGYVILNSQ